MEGLREFFSGIPLDLVVIGASTIVLALDSLRSGIGRAGALALAAPMAWVIFALIESALILKDVGVLFSNPWGEVGALVAALLSSYFVIRRMGIDYFEAGMGEPIQAIIAGAAATVVLVVFWLITPAVHDTWNFSSQTQAIFAEPFRLWWLLGAYALMIFARG